MLYEKVLRLYSNIIASNNVYIYSYYIDLYLVLLTISYNVLN